MFLMQFATRLLHKAIISLISGCDRDQNLQGGLSLLSPA